MESTFRTSRILTVIVSVIFGVLALPGVAIFYFLTIRPAMNLVEAQGWKTVPCQIVTSSVDSSDDGDTYRVTIRYRYRLGEYEGVGERYTFAKGSSSGREGKLRIADRYPVGMRTECFVDPDDPRRAVLDRRPGLYLLFGLVALPFFAMGIGVPVLLIRQGRHHSAVPSAKRPIPVHNRDTRQSAAGELTLYAGRRRWGQVVGTIVFSLFWNTVVAVFLFVGVIPRFAEGSVAWVVLLFFIPFAIVGIGSVFLVIHRILASFNPRPILQLSDAHLYPGHSVRLSWTIGGAFHRLESLTIKLIGRESATYRHGSDSRTTHHLFLEHTLAEARQMDDIRRGTATFAVPENVMPSFEARNNKIEWFLLVHGDIARWPDIKDELPITVYPNEVRL